jgi:hypothetical protein
MATNWTLSQALAKITEGTDKAAIQDIGRRFPLTAVALAEIGQNAGAVKIIGAVPSHITARKIESVLKDGVEQDPDVDTEDTEDEEETSKKENKKPAKKAAKANAEEDADDEEDDPVALYKKCKKAGIKVAPKKSAKYYKDQLAKAAAAEEDADDEDWDDEEEDEKPASKKKPVKKAPAKKTAKKAEPEDDEDEDEDEWDI